MARYFRKITSFSAKPAPGSTLATLEAPALTPLGAPAPNPHPDAEHTPPQPETPSPPRRRGRPRLEASEDRKPMGHRVPSALLRELTLVAAELAYLEDRKVQQQDLVESALKEFIARQRLRIEELRRQRQ